MTIAARIKKSRDQKGFSQSKLAEMVKVTRSSCSHWEQGLTTPSIENLSALARVLEVRFEWLATGRGEMMFSIDHSGEGERESLAGQKELLTLFHGLSNSQREAILNLLREI